MSKLLKMTISGVKNIEEPISLEFCNQSLERIEGGINKTKGVFGYNGAGKTALMTGVYLYRMVALSPNYLVQNQTQEYLEQLLNRKSGCFFASFCFLSSDKKVLKHSLSIKKDPLLGHYLLEEESLSIASGRTLNEKFAPIFSRKEAILSFGEKHQKKRQPCERSFSPYESLVASCGESLAKGIHEAPSDAEKLILEAFSFALQLDVYLQSEPLPTLSLLKERIRRLQGKKVYASEIDPSDEQVKASEYPSYEKVNASLERFVSLFKPSLKGIRLSKTLDGDVYHTRKEFVYADYALDLAYESSGIKQLVRLFHYLKECSEGGIVFVDEIDVNLNTAYFRKLLEYFARYGKGQLIFTTHNVEAMDILRKVKRGIEVIGINGKVASWVASGNRSPVKEYLDGYIPHSPLNIEDFDFIKVFQGEES